METQEKQIIKELIERYEIIIHGSHAIYGLIQCCDNYYKGCWDDNLNEVERLKKELKKCQHKK